ncbi:MAG: hypothetical protein ABI969_18235, partial [bacterium]
MAVAVGGVPSAAAQRPAGRPLQDSGRVAAESVKVRVDSGAPVVFDGDTLFRLFGSLGPFTATSRAAAASQRLAAAASAIAGGDSVVVSDRQAYSELTVGDIILFTVLDDDALPLGLGRLDLARRFGSTVHTAIVAARARRSSRALLLGAAYAVAATVVLSLLFWILSAAFPRLYRRIEGLKDVRVLAVRIQQFELLSAGRLAGLLVGLARAVRLGITLLLLYVYVPLVLSLFPWTEGISHRIVGYALTPFAVAWHAFVGYLPSLFYLAAGVVIIRYLLILVHLLFGALGSGA